MPLHPFKTNFTKGEVTPKLYGRTDLQGYDNGAEILQNFVVLPHGGVSRRAGTYYLGEVKDPLTPVRLVPFEFSVLQAYTLELGAGYIRFWADRAQVVGATVVSAATLTLSTTDGCTVTFTAAAAAFVAASDIHRRVIAGAGQAEITAIGSTTIATGNVLAAFSGTSFAPGSWHLSGAPIEVSTPYAATDLFNLRFAQSADVLYIADQHHAPRKLLRLAHTSWSLKVIDFDPPPSVEIGIAPSASLTPGATTGTTTVTASAAAFLASDVDRQIVASDARAVIVSVGSTTAASVNVRDDFASTAQIANGSWSIDGSPVTSLTPDKKEPVGAQVTLTLATAGWRSTDVGKFVVVHGGLVIITGVTSDTVAVGEILSVLAAVTAAPGGSWTLESEAWSTNRGFPGVVTLFEQRLAFAGSPAQPDTLWASQTADFENFAVGTDDSAALELVIADTGVNLIRWLMNARRLLVGTMAAEHIISSPTDEPLTGTNASIRPDTFLGADFAVDALRVGQVGLFLQRGARRLREFAFSFEADAFVAPDVSVLAEHLLREGVLQMAYLPTPDSVILCVCGDGRLLAMTYERAEQVVGWAPLVTAGVFESVAVIPNSCGTSHEAWMVVRRTINGATRRYVEVFDGDVQTDATVVYEGASTNQVVGLSHLNGETVVVTADGVFGDAAVVTCSVSLAATASAVSVGLPYTAHLRTLRIELPTGTGSSQARRKRWNELVARLYCTTGPFLLNGEEITLPSAGYTGDARKTNLGWDNEGRVTVTQANPLPLTLLALTGDITVGDD